MVSIALVQHRGGNAAGRFWPHSGHLGITPVHLTGIVRTKNDTAESSSSRPLLANAITISLRCYEARLGRVGVVRTNIICDHSKTLWSASVQGSYEHVPLRDFPFQISIPPRSPSLGQSTCHLQTYRVYWRIEATIHHIPVPAIGTRMTKHYEVSLIRYDAPRPATYPYASAYPFPAPIATPSHPFVHSYCASCPPRAVGPLEEFPVTFTIAVRPGVIPTKISTTIRRIVELFDDHGAAAAAAASPFASTSSSSSNASSNNTTTSSATITAPLRPRPKSTSPTPSPFQQPSTSTSSSSSAAVASSSSSHLLVYPHLTASPSSSPPLSSSSSSSATATATATATEAAITNPRRRSRSRTPYDPSLERDRGDDDTTLVGTQSDSESSYDEEDGDTETGGGGGGIGGGGPDELVDNGNSHHGVPESDSWPYPPVTMEEGGYSPTAAGGSAKEKEGSKGNKDNKDKGKSKLTRQILFQESSTFPRGPIVDDPWLSSRQSDDPLHPGHTYRQQIKMHVPSPKTKYHWAVGESMRTSMVWVRFIVTTKITLSTPNNSTETFKFMEREFLVASVDDTERERVLAQYELEHPNLATTTTTTATSSSSSPRRGFVHSPLLPQPQCGSPQSPNKSLSLEIPSGNGRRRRRSPSPQTAATAAPLHSYSYGPTIGDVGVHPRERERVSPLALFDRRKPSTPSSGYSASGGGSMPPTSGSSVRPGSRGGSASIIPVGSGGGGGASGSGGGKMRRPRTSTGAPPRMSSSTMSSTAGTTLVGHGVLDELDGMMQKKRASREEFPISISASAIHSRRHGDDDREEEEDNDEERSGVRRRLLDTPSSSHHHRHPDYHHPPFGDSASADWVMVDSEFESEYYDRDDAGRSGARVRSAKLGFEPDQVKAWEDELDRIAKYSKRRSIAIVHPGGPGAGSGSGSGVGASRATLGGGTSPVNSRKAMQVYDNV